MWEGKSIAHLLSEQTLDAAQPTLNMEKAI
jgi:hypothetical protein